MEDKGGDKMKIKIILGIFFVLVILAACKKEYTTDTINLHIEGVVTYSNTNKPVAHCQIELFRLGGELFPSYHLKTTYSDEDGRYCIICIIKRLDCVGGYLTLRVYIDGDYRWSSNPPDQIIPCTEELQIINIEIDPL